MLTISKISRFPRKDQPMISSITAEQRESIRTALRNSPAQMTLQLARNLGVPEAEIIREMPDAHRRFLISFERGDPDWTLIGLPGAADLPAVRWRQQNLDKLGSDERDGLVAQLEKALSGERGN